MADVTVVWGQRVSNDFKQKVLKLADELGTKADYLMAIMAFETGGSFDPAQKNRADPQHGPVGLIQFTSTAARSLGTTKAALVKMTAEEQLGCVEQYLKRYKHLGLSKLEDLYAAVHWPAATGRSLDYVLYRENGSRASQRDYRANRGFDADHDGTVTLGEAAAKVRAKLAEGEAFRG
jgi:hypothetical protein